MTALIERIRSQSIGDDVMLPGPFGPRRTGTWQPGEGWVT